MNNKLLRKINLRERWNWEIERIINRYETECGECKTRKFSQEELRILEEKLNRKQRVI